VPSISFEKPPERNSGSAATVTLSGKLLTTAIVSLRTGNTGILTEKKG
jgi:hypothetical protein